MTAKSEMHCGQVTAGRGRADEASGLSPRLKTYLVIVPSLDDTGPVNVAIDLAGAAATHFEHVSVRYLKRNVRSGSIPAFLDVARLSWSDLRNLNETVLHTHTIQADIVGYLFSRKRLAKATVTTIHNFFLDDMRYLKGAIVARLAWLFWSFCVRRFDHAVCISSSMLEHYAMQGFRNLGLVHNCRHVKVEHYTKRPLAEASARSSKMSLLFAGGLHPRKNIIGLISNLDTTRYDLLIAGEGKLRAEVQQACLNNPAITYLGFCSDVGRLMASVDALVLPSFSEGFPLVCLEAMAAGTPCLMSDIPVHRELEELGFGVVFDHVSYTDFDLAVSKLAEERFSAGQLKQRFQQSFHHEVAAQKYVNIFCSGLALKASGAPRE